MSLFEPTHCRQDAYTSLRDQLADLETTDGLVRAAVAVSMHELDDQADALLVHGQLDDLADTVRERVRGDNPRALLAHGHQVLFEEARFRGNPGDCANPANSYLPRVLETRLDLPITLTLVYKAVLERVGVPVAGINAPGHFLAAVASTTAGSVAPPDRLEFIDPFCGGALLTRNEVISRLITSAGGDLLLDETEDLLPVATHKQWLVRMIRNLLIGFDQRGQHEDRDAMAEMIELVEAEA